MINFLCSAFSDGLLSVLKTVGYVAIAICVLLLMVLIHELGHYIVGRILKFKINEFSIGFGKALFSWTNKRGEKISLRIFPLGGYCAFAGESDEESIDDIKKQIEILENGRKDLSLTPEQKAKLEKKIIKEKMRLEALIEYQKSQAEKEKLFKEKQQIKQIKKEEKLKKKGLKLKTKPEKKVVQVTDLLFNEQKPWKRILVYLAGVTFNFISAIIFAFILLVSYGYNIQQVVDFRQGYTQINLQKGDAIYAVDGQKVDFVVGNTFSSLVSNIDTGEEFVMTVKRDGEFIDVTCTMHQLVYDEDIKLISNDKAIYCDVSGNMINNTTDVVIGEGLYTKIINDDETITIKPVGILGITVKNYPLPFWEALGYSFYFVFGIVWIVLKTFWLLITFRIPITEIGGPIATISFIATAAQTGFANLLFLLPLIAANLAVFNLLPFPALDGSHILFTAIEGIRGKPINRQIESYIHFFGLVILFAFIIVVDLIYMIA